MHLSAFIMHAIIYMHACVMPVSCIHVSSLGSRQEGREGERKEGRTGREGGMKKGREGEREGRREEGREGGREGERKKGGIVNILVQLHQ